MRRLDVVGFILLFLALGLFEGDVVYLPLREASAREVSYFP